MVLLFSTLISSGTKAQISGIVFRDINSNGTQELSAPAEPGEYGITVKAYNAVNAVLATATTNASGNYSFSAAQIPSGTAVRLEFSGTAADFPSKRTGADRSNVQFVVAGAAAVNINYAIASKKLLSDNSNPYVAGTAATNGNALVTGSGNAGDNDNLYIFPYDLSNDGGNTRRVKNQYLGSVFGLAWQKESRTLFMAAYLKRHVSFGPNGIGAIYKCQIDATGIPGATGLLVDVNTIGINVGTDPRTSTLPGTASSPSTDDGVFAEVGKRGIGGIELADNGRDLYIVNMYQKKLHRINIGNPLKGSFTAADVTGNWTIPDPGISGTSWHPMALKMHGGKIYIGGVCAKEVTTAHNVADNTNLSGVVYMFDPATSSFTEVLRFPLTYRRGFTNNDYRYEFRDNYWSAWQNSGDISLGGPLRTGLIGSTTGSNATGIYYAQPMLSALEFDVDGSMIIGLRDRFGDQGGYANYFETGNVPGETYRALANGEVLRAGKNSLNSWTLESGGAVTSSGTTTITPGAPDTAPGLSGTFPGQTGTPWGGSLGPNGAYYYYNNNMSATGVPAPFNTGGVYGSHYTKSNGGLALLPGYNEVMTTAIDPVNKAYANGIIKNYNLGANAGNMSGRIELIRSNTNDPTNMGKAAALGDIEVLLDAQAVEIGNRVWQDLNGNGRQDANEPGIGNITMTLRSPGADNTYNTGDDQTWTTVTDANGNYYFDASFVNDSRRPSSWIGVSPTNSGILPGFEYKVEINAYQAPLSGLVPDLRNTDNANIDSDGTLNGTTIEYILNPGGSTASTSGFTNNYDIDFGFYNSYVLTVKKLEFSGSLKSDYAGLAWTTTEEINVKTYEVERSVNGTDFKKTGTLNSKGDGNFAYFFNDNIASITASAVYYRLKITDKEGKTSYSDVIKLDITRTKKITLSPNPFTSSVNLQIAARKKEEALVSIYNIGGQLVYNKVLQVNAGNNNISITDLGNLSKGVYTLQVRQESSVNTQKLVKQ